METPADPAPWYTPLNSTNNEIRVLTLHPGRWTDEICCTLHIVSLNNNPQYDALSYVWGDPHKTRPIKLNGQPFFVTTNLYNALRRLRRSEPRTVWADAICINQADNAERCHQVGIMGRIYKRTAEVQIYLGESRVLDCVPGEEQMGWDQPPRRVFRRFTTEERLDGFKGFFNKEGRAGCETLDMEDLREQIDEIIQGDENQSARDSVSRVEWLRQADAGAFVFMSLICTGDWMDECIYGDPESPLWIESLKSLNHLLDSPWWRRVWTFQEALLPDQANVIYGEINADICLIEDGGSTLSAMHLPIYRKGDFGHLPAAQKDILYRFEGLMSPQERARHSYFTYKEDQAARLLEHLHCTRERIATDPRDKVFGTLGMLQSLPTPVSIVPDYDMTLRQVYVQTAMELIRYSNTLGVLMTSERKSPDSEIPTWCPDWRSSNNNERADPWIDSRTRHFTTIPKPEGAVADLRAGDVLAVHGIRIDTVDTFTAPATQSVDIVEIFKERVNLIMLHRGQSASDFAFKPVFIRTMLAETVRDENGGFHRRASQTDESCFLAWYLQRQGALSRPWDKNLEGGDLAYLESLVERIPEARRDFWESNDGRAFFVTEQGYMGLGPPDIKAGDVVFALQGGSVPFVLRRASGLDRDGFTDDERLRMYSLVGYSYLNGFMDGEVVHHEEIGDVFLV